MDLFQGHIEVEAPALIVEDILTDGEVFLVAEFPREGVIMNVDRPTEGHQTAAGFPAPRNVADFRD